MPKTTRQLAASVSSPATGGPTSEGTTQAAAKAANTLARNASGQGAREQHGERDVHRAPRRRLTRSGPP